MEQSMCAYTMNIASYIPQNTWCINFLNIFGQALQATLGDTKVHGNGPVAIYIWHKYMNTCTVVVWCKPNLFCLIMQHDYNIIVIIILLQQTIIHYQEREGTAKATANDRGRNCPQSPHMISVRIKVDYQAEKKKKKQLLSSPYMYATSLSASNRIRSQIIIEAIKSKFSTALVLTFSSLSFSILQTQQACFSVGWPIFLIL